MKDARLFLLREVKMDSVEMEDGVFPVVRKRDIGEKNLTVFAMHKTNGVQMDLTFQTILQTMPMR